MLMNLIVQFTKQLAKKMEREKFLASQITECLLNVVLLVALGINSD